MNFIRVLLNIPMFDNSFVQNSLLYYLHQILELNIKE